MRIDRLAAVAVSASFLMAACATTTGERATIAQLRNVNIEVKEEKVEGGIDKAIEGYQRFLAETGESKLVPEAIRRLADLKVEKEYGILADPAATARPRHAAVAAPERVAVADPAPLPHAGLAALPNADPAPLADAGPAAQAVLGIIPGRQSESDQDFERRATAAADIKSVAPADDAPLPAAAGADLERAGARQAIALYQKLLAKYPLYDRKDQVLYHLSRAHAELGEVDEAMAVMNRLVKERPDSKYFDEVQFRRGEYFFTRKKFLDAEDAYKAVVGQGVGSPFYELALYKLGWTFYKQELYDESLDRFVALLDYKASTGFDFEKSTNELEKKRVDDTYRVISLAFSNAGGSKGIADFFAKRGKRPYEVDIYRNLAAFYLDKRRYHDAALTYKAFVRRDPFHKAAPDFDMQVIATYRKGGFPQLVIESTKEFARRYGLKAEYWTHYDPKTRPTVVANLKHNLRELADYYHSRYQDKAQAKNKDTNYREALTWYREYLDQFPHDADTPGINYQLAELLLENKAYAQAALEYEKTAYDYPPHEKAAAAGYAAVYARREGLKTAAADARDDARREVIRSSLRFADTFPTHEKAAVVLGAAADDLYEMKDYPRALAAARKLIDRFPQAAQDVQRAAWLVVGHTSLELAKFEDAEAGYRQVLKMTAAGDKTRAGVVENLAASIYKQGEQAAKREDYKTAAHHFLRVAQAAPGAKLRPVADYDGATALLQIKEWNRAIDVLQAFRKNFPKSDLQPQVTKKMALAFKESGQAALAAAEYERVERETKDVEQRRGALSLAGELYQQAGQNERAIAVYRRYVGYFPKPVDLALEARHKLAQLYKAMNDTKDYFGELKRIVDADAHAGKERTDRTRYLAATAALALAEPLYQRFAEIKLVKPFKQNLARKQAAMKTAIDTLGRLADYHAGEVTAAAAYYIAESYYNFSRALLASERPDNLNPQEREQYELALEDQAYPFEVKAIAVHEKNLELLGEGIYNDWIKQSLAKLAKLVPARYAKFEDSAGFIEALGPLQYQFASASSGASTKRAQLVQAGPALPAAAKVDGGAQ